MPRSDRFTPGDRGVNVKLYFFFNLGARWKWVVNATTRPLYPRGQGNKGTALLFFNLGARWKCVVNATPRPLYSPGQGPGTHRARGFEGLMDAQEGCGKSRPTGADKTGTKINSSLDN